MIREAIASGKVRYACKGCPAISASRTAWQSPSPEFLQRHLEWRCGRCSDKEGSVQVFLRDSWLQVPFCGAARLSRAPKFARCSAKAWASCASHVVLRSCRRILGVPIFKFHKYWLWRGRAGAGGLGAALRSLVSPQRCTTTCFDVCPICTRLSGQGTPPIN